MSRDSRVCHSCAKRGSLAKKKTSMAQPAEDCEGGGASGACLSESQWFPGPTITVLRET